MRDPIKKRQNESRGQSWELRITSRSTFCNKINMDLKFSCILCSLYPWFWLRSNTFSLCKANHLSLKYFEAGGIVRRPGILLSTSISPSSVLPSLNSLMSVDYQIELFQAIIERFWSCFEQSREGSVGCRGEQKWLIFEITMPLNWVVKSQAGS